MKVIVKPNSKSNKILGFDKDKDTLKVAIAKPAQNNKANLELVKFLSKHFKAKVRITRGLTSKEKHIRIG